MMDWHQSQDNENEVTIKVENDSSEYEDNGSNGVNNFAENSIPPSIMNLVKQCSLGTNKTLLGDNMDNEKLSNDILNKNCSPPLNQTAIKLEANLCPFNDNSNDILTVGRESSMYDVSPRSPPTSQICLSEFDRELELHVGLENSLPPYGFLLDNASISNSLPLPFYAGGDDDFKLINNSLIESNDIPIVTANSTTPWDELPATWNQDDSSSYSIQTGKPDEYDIFCDSSSLMYT